MTGGVRRGYRPRLADLVQLNSRVHDGWTLVLAGLCVTLACRRTSGNGLPNHHLYWLTRGYKTMELPVDYNELSFPMRRIVREEYVRRQNGLCHYCGYPLVGDPRPDIKAKKIKASLFPSGMFNHPVHLHHCHETGMTIGGGPLPLQCRELAI